jgi:DNA-binding CsgD family transcriptional regulator
MDRLRTKDLRAIIGVAQSLGDIDDAGEFNASILPLLGRLVASDLSTLNVIDPAAGIALRPAVDPPGSHFPRADEILGAYANQNPLIRARRLEALKWSDFLTRRELHRLDIYSLLYGPTSVEYQMAFTLPSPADTVIGFVLNRLRPDFTERDRSMLNGVRPFVQHAYERVTAGPRLRPARELGLTDRQGEILRLVAGGLTNAQIALRLSVTERTVGKHLENVYARLDVTSRTAAVARATGLGDSPEQPRQRRFVRGPPH